MVLCRGVQQALFFQQTTLFLILLTEEFGLLDTKPCRTIVKLPQKASFEPETCEIAPKLWFLASGFCLLRLGEPSAGTRGNPGGPPSVTAL